MGFLYGALAGASLVTFFYALYWVDAMRNNQWVKLRWDRAAVVVVITALFGGVVYGI